MGSWIAKRAEGDASLTSSAQTLHAELDAFWNSLCRVLQQNVAEFNALYNSRPERLAEFSGDNTRANVRLQTNPQAGAEVVRDGLRLVCRFGVRQRSRIAAEFRIFGDWDTTRVLLFSSNGDGPGVALPGGDPMDLASVAEFILAPILFPS
jgi:hypothetical protein